MNSFLRRGADPSPKMQAGAEGYKKEGAKDVRRLRRPKRVFRLVPSIAGERLLTRGGAPVELSGRALDSLIAFLSNPNEVVSKNDLLSQVWPDVTVEEARFHMANLRKVHGQDSARYIATVPGRAIAWWRRFRGRAIMDKHSTRLRSVFRMQICPVA